MKKVRKGNGSYSMRMTGEYRNPGFWSFSYPCVWVEDFSPGRKEPVGLLFLVCVINAFFIESRFIPCQYQVIPSGPW